MNNTSKGFTHIKKNDLPNMVDVSDKSVTERKAVAMARIHLGNELAELLKELGRTKKGPVLQTAVIGGIQGGKRTSELIPMCHPVPLSSMNVDIELEGEYALIKATAKTKSRTGVEMEALTAVSVAALTFYDMCKSVTKSMKIECVYLLEKSGGKSGDYQVKK
ncbi:MAG: cyclic pyranopterin monophosphate synthase MoaC [Deltaproteobacteria bacterium]|nr:cyclic pyranopterin monophosphate synthase MoaC [Deltaproteobacteria bacterium]|tara:strand:+ start:932 stop:1420 length:489 start_codon:yes stop_codon:yes gene_type:complete